MAKVFTARKHKEVGGMKKNIISILVACIIVFPALVFAGEYILEKGNGVDVCEAYGKNLNSFNLHSQYVMACERKVNPKYTKFKKPEWKKLELRDNIDLLKNIEIFLDNYGDISNNVQGWEEYIKSRIEGEYIHIKLSQIDINNDGKKENVIKYIDGVCPEAHYGTPLLVLNNNLKEIDIEKTKPLLQNPRHAKYRDLSEGWDGTMYDIFIYKNKTYFDRWRYGEGSLDEKTIVNTYRLLKVFITESDKKGKSSTKEICRYRYRETK